MDRSTRYTKRPPHYAKRTQATPGFLWWRASEYIHREGAIVPKTAPKPFYLAMEQVRWDDLMTWGNTYAIGPTKGTKKPVTPELIRKICDWCGRFGLPGYLLATTTMIARPSELDEPEHRHHDAIEIWPTFVRRGAVWQEGSQWFPENTGNGPKNPDGWLEREEIPTHHHAIVVYGEPDPSSIDRLQQHVACPIESCPLPGSEAFWKVYQEPVADILRAGRVLHHVRREMLAAKDNLTKAPSLYHLLQSNGWIMNAEGHAVWTAASLLGAFAQSQVVGAHPPRPCAGQCGGMVPPGRTNRKYCSDTCLQRTRKRAQRLKAKATSRPT